METVKKEIASQLTDTMDTNESRGTSPTTNEVDVQQQTENQKTLVAIQPKIHPDEPNTKRLKFIHSGAPLPNDGQDNPTTTPNSDSIENEEEGGLREEQPTPTTETGNEAMATSEHPTSSETSAAPATSKTSKEHIVVGSEKWRELKRVSHMEVERRRRETINDYINELARMIPTENRQKGAILRSTVAHIKSLKEQHDADAQKWALEKLLAEQTIQQLQEEMEKYKTRYRLLRDATKGEHGDTYVDSSDDEQQAANPPPQ